jgi:hypothetical protein
MARVSRVLPTTKEAISEGGSPILVHQSRAQDEIGTDLSLLELNETLPVQNACSGSELGDNIVMIGAAVTDNIAAITVEKNDDIAFQGKNANTGSAGASPCVRYGDHFRARTIARVAV